MSLTEALRAAEEALDVWIWFSEQPPVPPSRARLFFGDENQRECARAKREFFAALAAINVAAENEDRRLRREILGDLTDQALQTLCRGGMSGQYAYCVEWEGLGAVALCGGKLDADAT